MQSKCLSACIARSVPHCFHEFEFQIDNHCRPFNILLHVNPAVRLNGQQTKVLPLIAFAVLP